MSNVSNLILCLQKGKVPGRHIIELIMRLYKDKVVLDNYDNLVEFIVDYEFSINLVSKNNWHEANQLVEKSESYNIHLIPYSDSLYPRFLRELNDPPPLLHLRGNKKILDQLPGVSIVGTRKITKNGKIIAERLSKYMSDNGWVIISGLAIGVDSAVHQSVITNNGLTIAVLAGGLHEATPKKNAIIGDDILNTNGAWISEHPVGTTPIKQYFVKRNRIQVGLSAGSIIIEADEKSGTMTQAKFCNDLARPLFAVCPDNNNKLELLSKGSIQLINKGDAIPIESKEDYQKILDTLNDQRKKLINLDKNKQTSMTI